MTSYLFGIALFGRHFVMGQPGTPEPQPVTNASLLPPLWSYGIDGPVHTDANCWKNFNFTGPTERFNFFPGPSLVNPDMTVEFCVDTCDQLSYHLAGLINGDTCLCANSFNPNAGFEGFDGACTVPCAGNPAEACGGDPITPDDFPLLSLYEKQDGRCAFFPPTNNLTVGDWRFVYVFNDTVGARALEHNAVDLHPGLPRGNLTLESCTNACAASGFLIAGMEFADECYCGNSLNNNPLPIPGMSSGCPVETDGIKNLMGCKGNSREFCGGPNIIGIYILPGTTLTPIIPFGSVFDGL